MLKNTLSCKNRFANNHKNTIMKDINCPYCDAEIDINHDDGYGYEEDVLHDQECPKCEKSFVFNTSISYNYYPEKADCLNDGNHNYEITLTHPKCCAKMRCTMCDEERELTVEEKELHSVGTWDEYIKSLNLM